jgi:hypothetical protein
MLLLSFVPLNRQFVELRGSTPSDLDTLDLVGRASGTADWAKVCERRRVVILAEAGSGKSREIEEQVRLRKAAGQFAVYVTVEDVDRDGLEGALDPTDQAALADWKASDRPGWFFVDSIDEARLARVRFDRALRRVASGIATAERRAHIILTCRLTDWEPIGDLDRIQKALPIPREIVLPAPPAPDEELIRILRHERPAKEPDRPADEQPLVVLMAALDPDRVKSFARALEISNVERFLDEIEAANLWRFARRPLDLLWLVDHWKERGQFGSLAEMLESSLNQRVRETNRTRAAVDTLEANRAIAALERIGAALTLARRTTISIPDSELHRADDERPIDLAQVLPDWSSEASQQLLTRPFFDPATYGRARLHNDNESVVRGFLTARWLRRLTGTNLSRRRLKDLLFSTTYGRDLVKPSMVETAAWVAIWDQDIGREICNRDPWALLACGDPASLPAPLRADVLRNIVSLLASDGEHRARFDWAGMKRFATPDLEPVVRELWASYNQHTEARDFLLQLAVVGKLAGCVDLAASVAFDRRQSRYTLIFAGRTLTELADEPTKRGYGQFILQNAGTISNAVVLDAVDHLFPSIIRVADLLQIFEKIDVADADHGSSVEWQIAKWIDRVATRAELEQLLEGLVAQLGPRAQELGHVPDQREDAYFAGIAAAASQLMKRCGGDEAPAAAVDAAIRIETSYRYGNQHSLREKRNVKDELNRTVARRRSAFWQVADLVRSSSFLDGRPPVSVDQLSFLGYPIALALEDVDWLLAAATERTAENEQKLVASALLNIWRDMGKPADLLKRIEDAARPRPAMAAVYDGWMSPPADQAYRDQEEKWSDARLLQQKAREDREQGWRDFVKRLQADPDALRRIGPPTAEGVDGRLFDLWQLLSGLAISDNRYAISSIKPMEPALGPALTSAFQDALIAFWRHWRPRLKSERAPSERNTMRMIDCMGIAAVSLEAAQDATWAKRLSSADATRAVEYGSLEINGFPAWIESLSIAHPSETQAVLIREALAELDDPDPHDHYGTLSDASLASDATRKLLAAPLFDALQRRSTIPKSALPMLLGIIAEGLVAGRDDFLKLLLDRFAGSADPLGGVPYLSAAYLISPQAASIALTARLANLSPSAQAVLVEDLLPRLFGTALVGRTVPVPNIGFEALEPLVEIAFRNVRIEDDRVPNGEAFTPNGRDFAERARNVALHQLIETPGLATFATLHRLAAAPDCPVPAEHLRRLARDRALKDSDGTAWQPGDVVQFEATSEALPRTPADLQHTAMNRFDDLQHELLHADFAQGSTVKLLPDEKAVQNWVAEQLRLTHRNLYSVERESHVVAEKEPDIRLRARAADAVLSIEIKVAESWSGTQLETALVQQLCGQYLRHAGARHGILLLVHQTARADGWRSIATDPPLSFNELVGHLRGIAEKISSSSPDGPQPLVAMLDVSSFPDPIANDPKPAPMAPKNAPRGRRPKAS